MYNLNTRLRKLEANRAAIGSDHCPACGAYIGKATDFELVPAGTPQCDLCGNPKNVTLNLGRKVLSPDNAEHDEEIELFMMQMRELADD